jgi:hypothetical protein
MLQPQPATKVNVRKVQVPHSRHIKPPLAYRSSSPPTDSSRKRPHRVIVAVASPNLACRPTPDFSRPEPQQHFWYGYIACSSNIFHRHKNTDIRCNQPARLAEWVGSHGQLHFRYDCFHFFYMHNPDPATTAMRYWQQARFDPPPRNKD